MKIAITGGHHSSALPVIKKLKQTHPEIELVWFGHKTSMKGDTNETLEYKEITALGIPFIDLKAGKVYRINDWKALFKLPYGFIQAFVNLVKIKPNLILSFGGYLAVPVVVSGWFLNIPTVTHEQTVVAGYANKVIALFAKKILVSWKSSLKYFPQNKVIYTGLPLRKEIFEIKSHNYNVNPDLPTIYITAGKTGSVKLNGIIKLILPELLTYCNVIHQTGDHSAYNDYDDLKNKYESLNPQPLGKYFPRKFVFEDEIGEVFNTASLIVGRSGAHTCMELIALQKPALLIPIPWVSHNEQFENAKMVEDSGLAEILEEKYLDMNSFLLLVKTMLSGLSKYKVLDTSVIAEIGKTPAEDLIVKEVLSLGVK